MAPSRCSDTSEHNGSSFPNEHDNALVLRRSREFYYENRPIPALRSSRDVLIRVVATGLCGSDVHYWQHGRLGNHIVDKPLVLGHESAGIVEACGSDVKRIAVGDRVALEPGVSCNSCPTCRSGRYNLCESMQFAGTPPHDGTFVSHYCIPEECCFLLPPHISFEEGALVEPLSVAVHCCKLAGIGPGSTLVVYGAGPIGLLSCAVGRAFGATSVVVVDIVTSRLDFAITYGAIATYEMETKSVEPSPKSARLVLGLPEGPDVVIEATGVASCMNHGITALKRGGTFVQAGLGASRVDFAIAQLCDKEATFKGSFRYGPGDYDLAIELLRTRKVSVKELITNRFEFREAEQAFQTVSKRQGIKSIIRGPGVSSKLCEGTLA